MNDDGDNLIDLQQARDDRGWWITGWAQCTLCQRTWFAAVPEGYDGTGLDCPAGHPRAGIWPVPRARPG